MKELIKLKHVPGKQEIHKPLKILVGELKELKWTREFCGQLKPGSVEYLYLKCKAKGDQWAVLDQDGRLRSEKKEKIVRIETR